MGPNYENALTWESKVDEKMIECFVTFENIVVAVVVFLKVNVRIS